MSRSTGRKSGKLSANERALIESYYGERLLSRLALLMSRDVAFVERAAETVFPPCEDVPARPWREEDAEKLRRCLGILPVEGLARVLRRNSEDVTAKVVELKVLRKRTGAWSHADRMRLQDIYGTRPDEALAIVFRRSVRSIQKQAAELQLAKDKAYLASLRPAGSVERASRMPRWSDEELALLRKHYPDRPALEVARLLGRTRKSVVSKAHALGIRKSAKRLREMGRENVSFRYRDG